jgi:hypothetical protein
MVNAYIHQKIQQLQTILAAKLGTGIVNNVYNALKIGLLIVIKFVFQLAIFVDNLMQMDNVHHVTMDMI